jgi:hypothetical protein
MFVINHSFSNILFLKISINNIYLFLKIIIIIFLIKNLTFMV